MNGLRAALAGLLVLSCGGGEPQPREGSAEVGPLEPPRASGTAPLPSCPAGDGPLEAVWGCAPGGDAKLEVSATLADGALKLRVEAQALPAYRPIQVRIDVEPDGRADAVLNGRTDGAGALVLEQFNQTCAEHLSPVEVRSDACDLVRTEAPGAAAVP